MRTAEEYLKEKFPNADQLDWFKPICECLNTARREALEEAAGKIIIDGNPANAKQSILNMVKELK